MSKIANKLGLNPEASDEAINSEVDKILNKSKESEDKAKASDDKMKSMEEKMAKMKEELDSTKAEYDKMKNAFGEKEKESEEKDKEAKKDKAKNMIAVHSKRGAILNKADIIAHWEDAAIKDFDGTEKLLISIPVNNKESQPIVDKEQGAGAAADRRLSGSVMARQTQVILQNKFKA